MDCQFCFCLIVLPPLFRNGGFFNSDISRRWNKSTSLRHYRVRRQFPDIPVVFVNSPVSGEFAAIRTV